MAMALRGTELSERVAAVRARIAAAAARAGRAPGEVTLVAVTKTVAAEVVRAAHAAGLTSFGENRVRSLPDAVGRALELYIAQLNGDVADDEAPTANGSHGVTPSAPASNGAAHGKTLMLGQPLARITTNGNLCPQCGNSTMYYEEGCKKCVSCGYSEC